MGWNHAEQRVWSGKIRAAIGGGRGIVYIRYILKNIEPLRITDDSTSQYGQIDTLTYIPGMTIRGAVIQALAEKCERKEENWEQIRRTLFSDRVSFFNAYPMGRKKEPEGKEDREIELIPSLKGFCENKESIEEEKEITNTLKGVKEEAGGLKNASLGRYCYIDNQTIFFSNVERSGDMRIAIPNAVQEKEMFRSQYMLQNQKFCGYIAVEDPELEKKILSVFDQGYFLLGNGRSAGMGKCVITEKEEVSKLSYQQYNLQKEKEGMCYLYLLSNLVMRNKNGELTGIDIPTLEKQLGVEQLRIERCAVSTLKSRGYNRLWNTKLPEMTMYEMGSVFQLCYQGVIGQEKAAELLKKGIGIRRNEGFGKVLILEGYEELKKKHRIEKEKYQLQRYQKEKYQIEEYQTEKYQTEEYQTEEYQIESAQAKQDQIGQVQIKQDQTEEDPVKKSRTGTPQKKLYDSIEKTKERKKELSKEEEQVLLIAAKGYYLEKLEQAKKDYLINPNNRKNPILSKTLTSSQMGTIASYIAALQFTPKQAEKELLSYLEHAAAKEEANRVHTEIQKKAEVKKWIETLFQSDLDQFLESEFKDRADIMGIKKKECFTEEESLRWKLKFLLEMIRFANREETDNGEGTL